MIQSIIPLFSKILNNTFSDGCIDTDAGATDLSGDSCKQYKSSWCGGKYDDEDFKSQTMCCVCGGGNKGNFHVVM